MEITEYENKSEILEDDDLSPMINMNIQKTCDDTHTDNLGVCRYNNIMGVTCYMNSILHILQQIPLFVKYIYDFEFKQILLNKIKGTNKTIKDYVIYGLHCLFKTSLNNNNLIINPDKFKSLIGEKNDMWDELNHQDSQEFFNFLISQIKEEVGIKINFNPNIYFEYGANRLVPDSITNLIANNALTIYESHEYSQLTKMFDGLYENTCSCKYCYTTNIKFEPFLTLAIDITSRNDLYDCLDDLCCEQQLDMDNIITCGFCGLQNQAFKKCLLWKTPKILVIHIKRFGIMEQKITTNVTYPIKDLDLSNYIDQNSPFKLYCKYDLIGINLHQALGYCQNINAGHYTSIIKNRLNNNWYLYNDSEEPELIYNKKDLQSSDAYLLFYYRHN